METNRKIRVLVAVICLLQVFLAGGSASSAWALKTEVALFHDALAPYGNWIDYGNYGAFWHPSKVTAQWRPYMDGRWVPTAEGWVFETSEPWGWATYHYGNWFPTTEYGWLWTPGSTWYPSTAAWRTSDDYIGWAPTPPPDYVPEPAFYPAGGYYPGTPPLDLMTAPFWLFAQAASFLLGFGQPFVPAYSYYNCGCLSPFDYSPIVYGGTFPLTDFYYPSYAPGAFFTFGPPFPFVSRVSRVNIVEINNFANSVNIVKIRNGLPPGALLERHAFLREAIPSLVRGGRFQVERVTDITRAERQLNHPGVLRPPANLPALQKEIPRVMAAPGREITRPQTWRGVKGMTLPRQAERLTTPTMQRQIRVQRQLAAPGRIETRPEFRVQPRPQVHPGAPAEVRPTAPRREVAPTPAREIRPTVPREVSPAVPREVRPAPRTEFRTMPRPEFRATPAPAFRAAPRPEFRPAPQQQFFTSPRLQSKPSIPHEFRAVPSPQFRAPAPTPQFRAPAPAVRSAPAPAAAPHGAPAPGIRK